MQPRATADFETRSTASLRKVGSWRYSLDPSTEVLCMAYRLPHWDAERTGLWHPAFPSLGIEEGESFDDLAELVDWIQAGELVEAHNAFFERGIWANRMVPQYGWPSVGPSQWRCSAAKAAACALPRGLDEATAALRLNIGKDLSGSKIMQKCMKPRKPRKAERESWASKHGSDPHPIVYWESKDLFERLWDYCRFDVLAEAGLSECLPDLSPTETLYYLMDQTINERGFQIDQDAIGAALALIKGEVSTLNAELATLTGGVVQKATQRAQMLRWFESQGTVLPDTQALTLDEYLKEADRFAPQVKRGLEIVRTLGRSSTAKYESMANHVCPDGRVRGGLLYHGATTGRWSGSGVQPHNFVKGCLYETSAR